MKPGVPTHLLVHDWETFYDKDYSLSKLPTIDYIMDKRFQPICLAAKKNNEPTVCEKGDGTSNPKRLREMLMDLGWETALVVGHHNRFDASITRFRLKLPPPALYGCTRLMARAVVRPYTGTVSLKRVAQYYGLGEKGDQRETYIGYRLEDFTSAQLQDYMQYCGLDVDLTHGCFGRLLPEVPKPELINIDLVLRMFLHPQFVLDVPTLENRLAEIKVEKKQLLDNLPLGLTKDDLMSQPKFRQALEAFNVEIPTKISPSTGKEIPALAKSDEGFKLMMEEGESRVQALCAARVGIKSTIEETRTERMLRIAKKYNLLPVPLVYAGPHTLRYSGDEKINLQNLPRGGALRDSIRAPAGYVVIAADYAQIEARICATMAGCKALIDAFRDPLRDPYAEAASESFGYTVTNAEHPDERFAGKVQVLQLQYGSGGEKLRQTLLRRGVKLPKKRCRTMVDTYRSKYWEIPRLWRFFEDQFTRMAKKESFDLVAGMDVLFGMVRLPNGYLMPYRDLRVNESRQWVYTYGQQVRTLYGGKMVENLTQALAALLIREAMVRLYKKGIRTLLQVHDELVFIAPYRHVDEFIERVNEEMLVVPPWLPNLPLEVETHYGSSYGEAK